MCVRCMAAVELPLAALAALVVVARSVREHLGVSKRPDLPDLPGVFEEESSRMCVQRI